MTPERKLGYPMSERTRFSVRIQIDAARPTDQIVWLRTLTSLEEAQRAYIDLRNRSDLGASGFSEGQVFDEMGQHVARISYNGRLWGPELWMPGMEPVAEAPAPRPEPQEDGLGPEIF